MINTIILKKMEIAKLTRQELAEKLCVEYGTLNQILLGTRQISISVAYKLEEELGMNMEKILVTQLSNKINKYRYDIQRKKNN
jgi:transcriptional regulator with XRE-family HTH domain